MVWAWHPLIFLSCRSTPSSETVFQPSKKWRERRAWHFLFLIPDDVSDSSLLSSTTFIQVRWRIGLLWWLAHDLCLFIHGGCLFRGWSHVKEGGEPLKCFGWRDSRIVLRLLDTAGHSSCIHILAVCEDNLWKLWEALSHTPDATGLNFSP